MATREQKALIKSLLTGKKAPFKAGESVLQKGDRCTIVIAANKEFATPENPRYDENNPSSKKNYLAVRVNIKRGTTKLENTLVSWNQLVSTRRTDLDATKGSEQVAPYKGAKLVPNFPDVYNLVAGMSEDAYQELLGLPQGGEDIEFTVDSDDFMVQQFVSAEDRKKAADAGKPLGEQTALGKWKNGLYQKGTVYFAK